MQNNLLPNSCEDNELMKFKIPSLTGSRKSNSIFYFFLAAGFLAVTFFAVVAFLAGVFLAGVFLAIIS
jgi:hypothetical protein